MKWIRDNIIEVIVIMIIVVVTIFVVIGSFVNESNRISEGIVVDRDYTAGYTSIRTINSPPVYHPSRCTLTISGTKNGEEVEYTFEVPESEYVLYNIGDHYPKS